MMRRALPTSCLPDAWLSERGLASAEAEERRRRYGATDIVETPPAALWDLARDTAKDPMLWFLAGTSALCSDKTGTITEGRLLLTHLRGL